MRPAADILQEVDQFFMQTSRIHEAARALASELRSLGIPFVIAGALAANAHGHRRTTDDVEVLLTPDGLAEFKKHRLGLGWVERFPGSKGLRDVRNNVKIDVLLAGDYPGDGKPKPIAFPHPGRASELDELPFLPLKDLLEVKTASGMTAPHRMQDLADVMNLIRVNKLPREYAEELHPFVREKFLDLWAFAQIEDDL